MPALAWADLTADEVLLWLRANPGRASGFLDVHQWSPLLANRDVVASGGHLHAQLRRMALSAEPPVACWRIERSQLPTEVGNARQLRAYLYRGGLDSGSIGDIVAGDFFALATIPDVDLTELLPGAESRDAWEQPEVATERATVSTLRLDAVIAALFRVSRDEAQTAIEYGFVFRNFAPAKKRTAAVAHGDQLVFRTKGRIEIGECSDTTRSGRLAISFLRYPV